MKLLFVNITIFLQLHTHDVFHIKVSENEENEMSYVLPTKSVELEHISSFTPQLSKYQWVFISLPNPQFAPYFLVSELSKIPKNTIVGRFGCLPTSLISRSSNFRRCHPYPLLRHGFAISIDLLSKLTHNITSEFDFYDILDKANIVDDFRFYMPDENKHLHSFSISNTLSDKFARTTNPHFSNFFSSENSRHMLKSINSSSFSTQS